MTESCPSDEHKPRGVEQLVQRSINLPVDLSPVSGSIGAWLWLIGGIALLLVMLVWLVFAHSAMSRLEGQLIRPGAEAHAEHRQQLLSFETRLARVLSVSVESKLRALERSVERGPLTAEELRLIEATANELRLLQSNPAALAASASSLDQKEHPRYRSVAAGGSEAETGALLHHIAKLRQFYYASLIGFALFALLAAGLWLNTRRHHRLIDAPIRHRLPVFNSYKEGRQR